MKFRHALALIVAMLAIGSATTPANAHDSTEYTQATEAAHAVDIEVGAAKADFKIGSVAERVDGYADVVGHDMNAAHYTDASPSATARTHTSYYAVGTELTQPMLAFTLGTYTAADGGDRSMILIC